MGACRWELEAKEDGAVLALCRDVALGRQFLASVTHLHWDPRWPDVKLCQVWTPFISAASSAPISSAL